MQLDKFESTVFIYDKIIFKFQFKNIQKKHFGPKFKDFYFELNLSIKGHWDQNSVGGLLVAGLESVVAAWIIHWN